MRWWRALLVSRRQCRRFRPTTISISIAPGRRRFIQILIENGAPEGERSEKFQEVVWYLASMGWTIEQIVDELAKYPNGIGLKYANRLLAEVTRSFGKWQSHRRAGVTGSSAIPATMSWPQIQIRPGELPRVVSEAEDALLLLGRDIYQRGGLVVRPVLNQSLKASKDRETESWQLLPVTRPHLVEVLCCAAQFLRYDKRAKKFVSVDAPNKVAEADGLTAAAGVRPGLFRADAVRPAFVGRMGAVRAMRE